MAVIPAIPPEWMNARWWRGRVCLECRNHEHVWAHPHYVFHAIWKGALKGEGPQAMLGWRLDGPEIPEVLEKGHRYWFTVVLRSGDAGEHCWQRVSRNLSSHPPQHFRLEAADGPEEMDLSKLLCASPPPEFAPGDEATVQLDFYTPWEFKAPDSACSWHPNLATLGRAIHHATAAFLGTPAEGESPWPVEPIRILSACWELRRLEHPSRSQPGHTRRISGFTGPLFLSGKSPDLKSLWPWLLLGAEFQIGPGRLLGQGGYRPGQVNPVLDLRLGEQDFTNGWLAIEDKIDPLSGAEPLCPPGEERAAVKDLAERVRQGLWQASPVDVVKVQESKRMRPTFQDDEDAPVDEPPPLDPGQADRAADAVPAVPPPTKLRSISLLSVADRLVHEVLAEALRIPLERLFDDSSHGFRRGRGVHTAVKAVQRHVADGFCWALKTDIASFFDEIDLELLLSGLQSALPARDPLFFSTLRTALAAPLREGGHVAVRRRGLAQGSPLSPMLANFYLVDFDAAMRQAGRRMVRYSDDLAILCRSREEAQQCLVEASGALADLGLRLRPDKTRILDLRCEAFRFLGVETGGSEGPATEPEPPLLRRPLYLTTPYLWAGLEEGSLVLREGSHLRLRIPLNRVSAVCLRGLGGISLRLVDHCLARKLPVTLCDRAGHHVASFTATNRSAFDTPARHQLVLDTLGTAGELDAARRLVVAKLAACQAWLAEWPGGEGTATRRRFAEIARAAHTAADVDTLRGYEGQAGAIWFPLINQRAKDSFFRSDRRAPRDRADAWNLLLDIGYHLLFARISELLQIRHLHPYLGFLHSRWNTYPSLVCDLQEPFRARIDRLVLRLVNKRIIRPEDFELRPDHRWQLLPKASPRFLEAFEAEMDTRRHGERHTMRRQLERQADALLFWVKGKLPLWIYHPSAVPLPPADLETTNRRE